MGGIGGGSKPKATKAPVVVSRKVEQDREDITGSGSRSLGSRFQSSRKRTPSGGGFGGNKLTLG